MMHRLVEWSLKFRLLVVALAIATFSVGIIQLRSMPADALPEFAPPYVDVQAEALALSASEVDELITASEEQQNEKTGSPSDDITRRQRSGTFLAEKPLITNPLI